MLSNYLHEITLYSQRSISPFETEVWEGLKRHVMTEFGVHDISEVDVEPKSPTFRVYSHENITHKVSLRRGYFDTWRTNVKQAGVNGKLIDLSRR